jgi:hypothetical protein
VTDYIASNEGWVWKEAFVAYFKVLSHNLAWGTDECHEKRVTIVFYGKVCFNGITFSRSTARELRGNKFAHTSYRYVPPRKKETETYLIFASELGKNSTLCWEDQWHCYASLLWSPSPFQGRYSHRDSPPSNFTWYAISSVWERGAGTIWLLLGNTNSVVSAVCTYGN